MTDERDATAPSPDARWTRLGAALARAVRRQCPHWLSEHAEDIAQAALIKIMGSARISEEEWSPSSFYIRKVAHSALVDEIRRRQRRREVALEVVTEAGEEGPGLEPQAAGDPERVASFRQLGAAVRECLLTMKRERRLAVMLYLQDHSVPEAARILDWPAKRTENLVYRGLADLRQCLFAKGCAP